MSANPPRLDLSVLRTLYRYELKMLLRDRRTLLIAVVAPLLLFPAVILIMQWVDQRQQVEREATTFRYAITGSEAALARRLVEQALALPQDSAASDVATAVLADPIRRGEAVAANRDAESGGEVAEADRDPDSAGDPPERADVVPRVVVEADREPDSDGAPPAGPASEAPPAAGANDAPPTADAGDAGTSLDAGASLQAETRYEEVRLDDARAMHPDSLLEAGELHVVVEGVSAQEYRRERERERAVEESRTGEAAQAAAVQASAEGQVAGGNVEPLVPLIRLHYRGDSGRSSDAADRLADRLAEVRERHRDRTLANAGFPIPPAQVAPIESQSLASAEEEGGALLALFLTPLLVMLMVSGGSIVAVDAIAGEKERGTLEALLTTGARRSEIVASKQLAVITVGVAIAVINVANLLAYLGIGLLDVPEELAAVTPGPATLMVLLLLFLPVAVLVSSALLLLSGYSKSYKEYQVYFLPMFMLFLLPSFAAVLPGLELRSLIVLAPLANVSVAVREVLTGEFDWPFLALAFTATSAAALWGTRLTSRVLSTERLITAAELDRADLTGGPALFPRRVLRWFATLWALLLIASLWMGTATGIRVQVAFNLLGLFLGATILMLWRYGLDPREALALRAPPRVAWLAVLIGAPSALITGVGLAQLANFVLPVPESVLESFGQYLLPEEVPFPQIVLFLCILPGICEELAFRGVLLHGLRRRFSPVALALVVGAIFGMFHVSLFRLVPTAYLGAVLAGVVLLTGSIFPAMLWHALNNAAALLPAYFGWWAGETPPGWSYPVAFVGLALSFWILWRSRSPYPGLRSRSPDPALRGRPPGPGPHGASTATSTPPS